MNSVPRKVLIAAVSWEERFIRGLERLLAKEAPEVGHSALLPESADMKRPVIGKGRNECANG